MRAFDLVFTDALATDNKYILLIKVCRLASSFLLVPTLRFTQAIILFECGKHDDAISRIDDLIDIVGDQSVYITVRVRQREYLRANKVNKVLSRLKCSSYLEAYRSAKETTNAR